MARHKKQKILILFDLPEKADPQVDFREYLLQPDWRDERQVYQALQKSGYDVRLFGIFDDLAGLFSHLQQTPPDIVFLCCESFLNKRELAPHLSAFLQLAGLTYTGADPRAQLICGDKALSKKILNYHGIKTPGFQVFEAIDAVTLSSTLRYPLIVKPLHGEGSEGITRASIVKTATQAHAQIKKLRNTHPGAVIVEEFIEGRELYVGVIGNKHPQAFPPREFVHKKSGSTLVATYQAKWNKKYRKEQGIKNCPARNLKPQLLQDIQQLACRIYLALELRGYARIDLRVTANHEIYFLEANANPGISRDDDFAASARQGGMGYGELLDRIIKLAAS